MFADAKVYPLDPIMTGADCFAADRGKDKRDLTLGIYQGEHGRTPLMDAVKRAEQRLVETQTGKSCLDPTGDAKFFRMLGHQILGDDLDDGWISAQTSGGTVGADIRTDHRLAADADIWRPCPDPHCDADMPLAHPQRPKRDFRYIRNLAGGGRPSQHGYFAS